MNKETLEALAREAAKGIKTEQDLNEFRQMLTKVTVERALNAELDQHQSYSAKQGECYLPLRGWDLTRRFAKFQLP